MNVIRDGAPDLPYSVCMGNHDYKQYYISAPYIPRITPIVDPTAFHDRFGAARYAANSWYRGGYNDEDHCQVFPAGDYQFLHINLRDSPSAADLAWAQGVLDNNPGKPAILSTHDYLAASVRGARTETTSGRTWCKRTPRCSLCSAATTTVPATTLAHRTLPP